MDCRPLLKVLAGTIFIAPLSTFTLTPSAHEYFLDNAEKRGYQPISHVLEQVRRKLRFHCNTLPNHPGFFSCFNIIETG
jgi:hypothetical protein